MIRLIGICLFAAGLTACSSAPIRRPFQPPPRIKEPSRILKYEGRSATHPSVVGSLEILKGDGEEQQLFLDIPIDEYGIRSALEVIQGEGGRLSYNYKTNFLESPAYLFWLKDEKLKVWDRMSDDTWSISWQPEYRILAPKNAELLALKRDEVLEVVCFSPVVSLDSTHIKRYRGGPWVEVMLYDGRKVRGRRISCEFENTKSVDVIAEDGTLLETQIVVGDADLELSLRLVGDSAS